MATISSETTPSIHALYAPVALPLERMKESLGQIVPPDSQLLAQTIAYALTSGGKYLRPVLTLLCGFASRNGRPYSPDLGLDPLVEVAAVSEMIHIATLLHDDVLDDASIRRGKKTVSSHWGNTISILSGDYLLAQASLKLANIGNIRLVGIYSQVLSDLCDGEVEQIRASYQWDVDSPEVCWESYFHKTFCKTASLFEAGCASAGILNGLSEDKIDSLKLFGRNIGIAFQVMDDLLDYTSTTEDLGKPVLDDLKNGLLNAPMLILLDSLKAENPAGETLTDLIRSIHCLFEAKTNNGHAVERAEQDIRHWVQAMGAIEKTRALAQDYIRKAVDAIAFLPESAEKASLLGLAQYVIARQN